MSFNTELYEGSVQEPPIWIWVKLIILLALFLIIPYLYVKFVEEHLKSFLGKVQQKVSFEFGRKFQWMWL